MKVDGWCDATLCLCASHLADSAFCTWETGKLARCSLASPVGVGIGAGIKASAVISRSRRVLLRIIWGFWTALEAGSVQVWWESGCMVSVWASLDFCALLMLLRLLLLRRLENRWGTRLRKDSRESFVPPLPFAFCCLQKKSFLSVSWRQKGTYEQYAKNKTNTAYRYFRTNE